jgi:carboxypeptidase Taq
LDAQLATGDFQPLLSWLRASVHHHGRCLDPRDLVERCAGEPISTQPFIDYLRGKLGPLYGFA